MAALSSTLRSRVSASVISAVLRARKSVIIEFEASPSVTRLSSLRKRSSCIPRLPASSSCLMSMLPLHTAIATARLQSVLAAESQRWGLVPQEITVATGELQKYYQRRKSHRTVSVVLRGEKVPLYGAGAGLTLSSTGGAVPLTLDFDIISRGYVIGKLVRVKHQKHISCPLVVDSSKTKPIKFSQNACTYF